MKTNKCEKCGKRYKLQDWKEGDELIHCFTCIMTEKMMKGVETAYNMQYPKPIKITWTYI